MAKPVVLLIHDVGDTGAGEMLDAVGHHSERFGLEPRELHEFHWNSLIRNSEMQGRDGGLVRVIRGILGSALVDDVPRLAAVARAVFFQLLVFAPVFAAWSAIVAIRLVGEPKDDAWRGFMIPLYLLVLPIYPLGYAILDHSSAALRQALDIFSMAQST
jgi:hypothetical protein